MSRFPTPPRPPRLAGRAPNLDAILSIPVTVQVVLGTTTMPVARLMKLGRGAVITLDQRVGAPVSVLVNGRTVARGEVVVVDEDNSRFGVTLTEIVNSPDDSAAAALNDRERALTELEQTRRLARHGRPAEGRGHAADDRQAGRDAAA